jgi:hypothetical protein
LARIGHFRPFLTRKQQRLIDASIKRCRFQDKIMLVMPSTTEAGMTTQSAKTERPGGGTMLGFPLKGFGLLTSLLLSFAAAFFTFFASTAIAIFSLLAWNLIGHHTVDYADAYRWIGFPAGLLVLVIALPVFGTLWIRAKLRK